ncbi:MAG: YbaB/EbfC family nucleoid-associated protein [Solirubrobacteraceae bacterium]
MSTGPGEPSAEDVHAVVAHVEQGFRAVQAELRDQVFMATSVDESVRLEINGEGLAVRVQIDPALLERGARAVELGVMQACNDAAIMLQEHTTIVFQLAAAQLLGLPTADGAQDLPPSLRAHRDA